jgi:hypothetical protein
MARRPEHDPIAGGLPEAGVRRAVVAPDVRLELDDATDSPPGLVIADEAGADERSGRLQRRRREDGAIDRAQSSG